MWSETDLDSEQFVSEHLLTGTNSRPKENGDYHHHSLDPVDPLMGPGPGGHNHLLRHEMLSDAMLGHVSSGDSGLASLHTGHTRDRDQVKWAPPATGGHRQSAAVSAAQWGPVLSVIKLSGKYRAKCTPPAHCTCHLSPDLTHVSTLNPAQSTFNMYCSLDDRDGR